MIYIVTVYDSLNYGSYFQAIALQKEAVQYGKTLFIDIKHQSTLKQSIVKMVGHLLKGRYKGIHFELKKWQMFKCKAKSLPVIREGEIVEKADDIYIMGSDEIWNVSRKKFLKSKEFWGIGLKKGKRISYAPSINTATKEQYIERPDLLAAIESFDSLSVRDEYSKDILEKLIECKINLVSDPVFLYGVEKFKRMEKEPKEREPYILVYTYGRMCKTAEQIDHIRRAAHRLGLKVISVGKYLKWADKSLNATPEEFLGYIHRAEYIVTDTFHGTVFSILYRKNFVVINPANKIKDLLNRFGLTSRCIMNTSQLTGLLAIVVDYRIADFMQKGETEASRDYLKKAVE
ncbi:hypothetical protein M2150_000914 [Lachnospiraceae bacterium PM6-15]|uniref:polysaccharide pyruvyl transferase family protein n=1 Tax=Ohessyouella blattaphilus TaxID=2949333 RepID=UPI003E224EBD